MKQLSDEFLSAFTTVAMLLGLAAGYLGYCLEGGPKGMGLVAVGFLFWEVIYQIIYALKRRRTRRAIDALALQNPSLLAFRDRS